MSNNKKQVISEEIALSELKSFIHKFVKRPVADEKLSENYPDILEAIEAGHLVIDNETKEPVYTLRSPIHENTDFVVNQIKFKTRITPNTKANLASGIDLQKDVAKYSLVIIAHVIGVASVKELDLFDRYDYDVISQVATVFM